MKQDSNRQGATVSVQVKSSESGVRRQFGVWSAALVLLLVAYGASNRAWQASGPQEQTARPVLTEETQAMFNGWALLAAGDTAKAAGYAQSVLDKYPRNIAAAALRVEAEIARGGGQAGLLAYENWLGGRKLEDGYLLRRAARAILWEAAGDPAVGVEALQHLAADEDPEARAQLARRMVAGALGETRALARLGDQGAIQRLIRQIETGEGSKMMQIEALIQSKSPLAIPPLMKLLKDTNYQDHVAAAADGLGTLGATQAIPDLQRLYNDTKQISTVRLMAAVGLFKMNDMTGIQLLMRQLASDVPMLSIGTAQLMASNPGPEWRAAVQKGLSDPDPAVRVMAAELLAVADREASRAALEQLLLDDNQVIREKASQAMVQKVVGDFGTFRRFLRAGDALTRVQAGGRVLELTR
jgi:HEAT repeat protein